MRLGVGISVVSGVQESSKDRNFYFNSITQSRFKNNPAPLSHYSLHLNTMRATSFDVVTSRKVMK